MNLLQQGRGRASFPVMQVFLKMFVTCVNLGANPNRRDNGRGLCAEEWARFCGCHNCADAIAKYIRSKKYFFKKTFMQLSKERWASEPDLFAGKSSVTDTKSRSTGSWIQRHLSLKRKKPDQRGGGCKSNMEDMVGSVAASNRCGGSAPLLITISPVNSPPSTPAKSFRRPSCIDGVVPTHIIPKLRVVKASANAADGSSSTVPATGNIPNVIYEEASTSLDEEQHVPSVPPPPPQIMATDFDSEMADLRAAAAFQE